MKRSFCHVLTFALVFLFSSCEESPKENKVIAVPDHGVPDVLRFLDLSMEPDIRILIESHRRECYVEAGGRRFAVGVYSPAANMIEDFLLLPGIDEFKKTDTASLGGVFGCRVILYIDGQGYANYLIPKSEFSKNSQLVKWISDVQMVGCQERE